MWLATPADTHAFGRALGRRLRPGDLVLLTGPLGAGKTALTQGIGAGLGVTSPIASPTFVIARVHTDGRIPLVHVDAYRLGSIAEVDDMDLDVSLADSVTVIEWGSGLAEQLSESRLEVVLDRPAEREGRSIELIAVGGDWDERLAGLGQALTGADPTAPSYN